MKIENLIHKRSHKLDSITFGRIRTFPFLPRRLVAYDPGKTRLSESGAEAEEPTDRKAQSWILSLVYSSASVATPAMQFSLDLKRQSHKQKQCSASNSTGLIFTWLNHSTLLSTTPTITPLLVNTSLKRYQPYIPCYLLWYFISSISYKIPYKLLLWTFWG